MLKISLCDGKYEITRSDDFSVFSALRHGKPWRNLVGDNLVLALCDEICELRKSSEPAESPPDSPASPVQQANHEIKPCESCGTEVAILVSGKVCEDCYRNQTSA